MVPILSEVDPSPHVSHGYILVLLKYPRSHKHNERLSTVFGLPAHNCVGEIETVGKILDGYSVDNTVGILERYRHNT